MSTLAFIVKLDPPALAYVWTCGLQNSRARVWRVVLYRSSYYQISVKKRHQTSFSLWMHGIQRNFTTREFFGILVKFVTLATKISLAHAFSTSKKKRFGEGAVVTDLSPRRMRSRGTEGVCFFWSTMIQHPPFNHSQWFGREHLPLEAIIISTTFHDPRGLLDTFKTLKITAYILYIYFLRFNGSWIFNYFLSQFSLVEKILYYHKGKQIASHLAFWWEGLYFKTRRRFCDLDCHWILRSEHFNNAGYKFRGRWIPSMQKRPYNFDCSKGMRSPILWIWPGADRDLPTFPCHLSLCSWKNAVRVVSIPHCKVCMHSARLWYIRLTIHSRRIQPVLIDKLRKSSVRFY